MKEIHDLDNPITLHIGRHELIIRKRYETLSILNDFLIAFWFLLGSVMFLDQSLELEGTWLFILGSFQLLIRPSIRLIAHLHLQKIPSSHWEG